MYPLIGAERPRIWKFNHCAGPARSRFLLGLKEKKILGVRCPTCDTVYVPPRGTCYRCWSDLDEWIEVADEGTLLSYAIMYANSEGYIRKAPFAYGLIKLDGAGTALLHFVDAPRLEDLKIGGRMKAVFEDSRTGSILDIKWFERRQSG